MAAHSSPWIILCLLLPTIVAMAADLPDYGLPNLCQCPKPKETNLHMYLHQFPDLPNVANPNEAVIIQQPNGFGNMVVDDWILTEGTNPNEAIIGRAQGFHLQTGQTSINWYTSHIFVFQSGSFAGSTLQVLGFITPPSTAGQWAIIGGTGSFSDVHGTIIFKVVPNPNTGIPNSILELDVHVVFSN